ncbi:MAG: gamma-glutamyltransferase [Acidiferrobacterales bacterium]
MSALSRKKSTHMRDIQYPGRSVVMSTGGMVATSQPMATHAGLSILRSGGNAIDAAIAASATLCVTEPQSTGVGGDCFFLYHDASSGKLYGLNGSGRAPQRATLAEYRRRGYTHMPEHGMHSVTVPGAVDAWQEALERFGTRSLEELLQPAIGYAEDGYAVSPVVGKVWKQNEALLAGCDDTRRTLLVDECAPVAGTRHRQPNLARSLRAIARGGRDAFYKGEIARQIVAFSKANDGLLELEDFAGHTSNWVEPISTDYRGLRVYEIPPNGQGIVVLMMLNMLENIDVGAMKHLSADHIHIITETFRLAIAERDRFVSDPDFSEIPVAAMLSKDFASRQWSRVDRAGALSHPVTSGLPAHRDTIYLTVVDEQRNAVSFINSLYHPWGSGMVAGETGIMLQNRGGGFNLIEGHANCIAAGKRPLHTIIPSMVYRDDRLVLSFGVMGGEYQAMGHSYVLTNWLDFGMDLQEAVDAARFLPAGDVLEVEKSIPPATRQELERRGHKIADAEKPFGGGQCIYIDWDNGVLQAASDPRKDGCALGY